MKGVLVRFPLAVVSLMSAPVALAQQSLQDNQHYQLGTTQKEYCGDPPASAYR